MKRIPRVLFLAVSLFLMAACNSKRDPAAEKDSYEKTKETLEEKEKKNPLLFLSVTGDDKHNLIGQTVIKGEVANKAKVSAYKDVELEISFYSKTGVLLEKGNETVYDVIAPGRSVAFKIKNFAPKASDSVGIKILNAKIP